MTKLFREYRFFTVLGLLLLVPVLSLNSSHKPPEEFSSLEKLVVLISAPLQKAITLSIDRVAFFIQNYIFLQRTRQDFATVVEENRKLLNTIHNFKEMEAESIRLRALLQFQSTIEHSKITAQVIARDVSTEFRSLRINKGSDAGVVVGMPVVTHEGVVGRILRTTKNYSDIITILDNLSAVDAVVQRTRAHGILEGETDSSCLLKYVLRTDDIEVGDIIISSGLDGIFLKGLLLGRVARVNKRNYGISQDVEIKPSVDFSRLEEVLVILKPDKSF